MHIGAAFYALVRRPAATLCPPEAPYMSAPARSGLQYVKPRELITDSVSGGENRQDACLVRVFGRQIGIVLEGAVPGARTRGPSLTEGANDGDRAEGERDGEEGPAPGDCSGSALKLELELECECETKLGGYGGRAGWQDARAMWWWPLDARSATAQSKRCSICCHRVLALGSCGARTHV